jgi:hypothetical protein
MPRKEKSAVKRAGGAIARTARKLTTKLTPGKRAAAKNAEASVAQAARPKATPGPTRTVQRKSDVPLDMGDASYVPKQTSLKASFRSNGADQQDDQQLPLGAGERFQDEDHYTNKSGDARIGTHGRTYEPGEAVK